MNITVTLQRVGCNFSATILGLLTASIDTYVVCSICAASALGMKLLLHFVGMAKGGLLWSSYFAHFSGIIPYSFPCLLFSKLCWHNVSNLYLTKLIIA